MISNMLGEQVFEGSGKFNLGIKDATIQVLKTIFNGSPKDNISEKEEVAQDG